MRWPTNFYDFRFKSTATAPIRIYPTKAWLSQLVNFKNAIWTLEERYAIKFCLKLGKNATETYGMLQTAFRPSGMNWASVFEWHKRFKEGTESLRDNERCGRSKEVNTPELIGQTVRVRVTMDNTPVHNSILVTEYLTKIGIKTVPQPPYSPDLAPCDFW